MSDSSKIKAILFDLDGVLVDTSDAHFEALKKALGLCDVEVTKDEHDSVFSGLTTKQKLERLEEDGRLQQGLKETVNENKQKFTKELLIKCCKPEDSKITMLKELKKHGYTLACCSNSTEESVKTMLTSAQLFDFFDFVIAGTQVKNPKPDPEIYLTTFKTLNIEPSEAVIVEDSPIGIEAAQASGAMVYEVRGIQDVQISLFNNLIG